MFSCDYNGWADVREEEREAIEEFEARAPVATSPLPASVVVMPVRPADAQLRRKAA